MADAAIHGHDHEDQRGFFTRWFMSTNHKDIGILYLIFSGKFDIATPTAASILTFSSDNINIT